MDGARRLPAPPRGLPDRALRLVPSKIRGVEFWQPGTDSLNRAFVARVEQALHHAPTPRRHFSTTPTCCSLPPYAKSDRDRSAVRGWLESLGRTREPWLGRHGANRVQPPAERDPAHERPEPDDAMTVAAARSRFHPDLDHGARRGGRRVCRGSRAPGAVGRPANVHPPATEQPGRARRVSRKHASRAYRSTPP